MPCVSEKLKIHCREDLNKYLGGTGLAAKLHTEMVKLLHAHFDGHQVVII